MKNRLLVFLLLTPALAVAQTEKPASAEATAGKGAAPLSTPQGATARVAPATRAVVVGISDYQDEGIPDLQYAHRDAEAFVGWLASPAGGSVPPENIQLLLNEKATLGNVAMALTWLYEQSIEGDGAIICFSGHGDVEKGLFGQPGYLLCYDAPPVVYMSGGALPVNSLQVVVTTLSLDKKAQVLIVTDACRAGKLAGSATGGAQLTTANLAKQFAGEVKLLSCQPNEFSLEGEQWGGGRGAFSYHLLDGLYGLADRDGDLQIKLKEIGRYLEDRVPLETDPQVQNPVIVGDREAWLARVEPALLAQRQTEKQQELTTFSPGDMRGLEEQILAGADSSIQQLYQTYLAAVESGRLMTPQGHSANDYFEVLIREPAIEQLHGFLKRHFVAALIDEAQQVTNRLLKTDPDVVSDTWSRPFVFDHIPAYLERATAILGVQHFFYKQLKAKQHYFEAKTYRKDNYPNLPADSLLRMAVRKMEEGLSYDSNATYIYVELGITWFWRFLKPDKAMECARKALARSPNWAYAHFLAGRCFSEGEGDTLQAAFHYQKALELDSLFLLPLHELARMYLFWGVNEKMAFYRNEFIRKAQALILSRPEKVPVHYFTLLGYQLMNAGRLQEAEEALLKAEELTRRQDYFVYGVLSQIYTATGRFEDAVRALEKSIELNPLNVRFGYAALANLYEIDLDQPLKAAEAYQMALSIDSTNLIVIYRYAKMLHVKLHMLQEAVLLYEKAMRLNSLDFFSEPIVELELAILYAEVGRQEEATQLFEKIIERLLNSDDPMKMNLLWRAYLGMGKLDVMKEAIHHAIEADPDNNMILYQAACVYSVAKNEQKALDLLEQALIKGFKVESWLNVDSDLENIRQSAGFNALMKKYFPDKFKN